MTRTLWILIACLVVLTTGCTQPAANAPVSLDPCADQSLRDELVLGYEAELLQAQDNWGMPQEWMSWVTSAEHKGWYTSAYIHARCRNPNAELPILLTYYGGRSKRELFFRGGWSQEKEDRFLSLMERYMEKTFSGFNFYLSFNSEGQRRITEEDAALVLVVGYDHNQASFATDKHIYLIYPTIVGHEAAHLCPQPYNQNGWCMGYGHHYCDDEINNHERCAPPGEFEVGCLMHRNAAIFGPMEQIISKLTYPTLSEARQALEDEIASIGLEIKAMLPKEMAARGEAEFQAPHNYNLELTSQQLQDRTAYKQLLQKGQH